MIEFSEFIEKKYPTEDYPNEKSAKNKLRKQEVKAKKIT